MAPKFLSMPASVKKNRLADTRVRTVVRSVPPITETAIFNLTIAENLITISYGNRFIRIYNPILHLIGQESPGHDHANYLIEPVYWSCIDSSSSRCCVCCRC